MANGFQGVLKVLFKDVKLFFIFLHNNTIALSLLNSYIQYICRLKYVQGNYLIFMLINLYYFPPYTSNSAKFETKYLLKLWQIRFDLERCKN